VIAGEPHRIAYLALTLHNLHPHLALALGAPFNSTSSARPYFTTISFIARCSPFESNLSSIWSLIVTQPPEYPIQQRDTGVNTFIDHYPKSTKYNCYEATLLVSPESGKARPANDGASNHIKVEALAAILGQGSP
jgi:hypothetical protein